MQVVDKAAKKKRLFSIIEVGNDADFPSRFYDFFSMFVILLTLLVAILETYEDINEIFGSVFATVDAITCAFFAVDCALRVYTAEFLHPNEKRWSKAAFKYVTSFTGIIDILSFLPYYLPFFFPAGAIAFRLFRIVRILRLFRINAYYDSLNVIAEVISDKKQQLISSVFILFVMMLSASLCMYSLEHEAQPEAFSNAFSGMWWSVSAILTVGYGDICPITALGRFFSIVISFLGVGMVAIPTGIISAGFVEHYSRVQRIDSKNPDGKDDVEIREARLHKEHPWIGLTLEEAWSSGKIVFVMVKRGNKNLAPAPNLKLRQNDICLFYSKEKS